MADKTNRIAYTGNMDKDSDVRYVGKGNNAGDGLDARNIQAVDAEGNVQGSIPPTLGNEFAFDLGSVSQQNKRYRITFDGDAAKQHELMFLSTQRDARLLTGTGPNGELQFNGIRANFIAAFNLAIAGSGVSWVLSTPTSTTVELELASYPMYQWYLDSVGSDVVDFTCIAEAIPVDLAGPLKDIGSYDLLGDLFIFSTTQDNEPTAITPTIILAGPTSGGSPNTYIGPLTSILFNGAHGLVQGQWIRITGSNEAFLNGLFVVHSIVDPQTVRIVTSTAWGVTPTVTTLGTPQVFIHPSGIGEIGVAQKDDNTDTWTYTRLLRSVELNFVSKWQVDCHAHEDASGTNLYYTDDYNLPRRFRYAGEYQTDGALHFVSDLNGFSFDFIAEESVLSRFSFPVSYELVNQYATGGALSSGDKYYTTRIVFSGEETSLWSPLSEGVPVFDKDPDSSPPYIIHGTTGLTQKRNELMISGLNPLYMKKMDIAVIENTEGVLSALLIKRVDVTGNSIVFIHSGLETDSVLLDVAEVIPSSSSHLPLRAKNIRSIDSRNVLSNIELIGKIDLSDWVKTFRHSIKRKELTESTGWQLGEYQSPVANVEDKGFMLNEVYRVGCRVHLRGIGVTDVFHVDDIKVDCNPINTTGTNGNRRNSTIPNFDLFKEQNPPIKNKLFNASVSEPGINTGSINDPTFIDQRGILWSSSGGDGWMNYSGNGQVQSDFIIDTAGGFAAQSLGSIYVPYIEIEDIDFSFYISELSVIASDVVEAIEFFIGDTPNFIKASGAAIMSVETPDFSPNHTTLMGNTGGLVDHGQMIEQISFSKWPLSSGKYLIEWPFATGSMATTAGSGSTGNSALSSLIALTYPCFHLIKTEKFTERKDVLSFYSGDTVFDPGRYQGSKLLVFGAYDLQNNIAQKREYGTYKRVTGQDRSSRPNSFWAKFVAHKTLDTYASYDILNQIEILKEDLGNPTELDYSENIAVNAETTAHPFFANPVDADAIEAPFIDGTERFSKRLAVLFAIRERAQLGIPIPPLNPTLEFRNLVSMLCNQAGPVIKINNPVDMNDATISPSFVNQNEVLRYSNRGVLYSQIYKDETLSIPFIEETSYRPFGSMLRYDGGGLTKSHPLSNGDTYTQTTIIRHRFPSMTDADISQAAASLDPSASGPGQNGTGLSDVNSGDEELFIREIANLAFSSGLSIVCQNRVNANLFTIDHSIPKTKYAPTKNGSSRWMGATRSETEPPEINRGYIKHDSFMLQAYRRPIGEASSIYDLPARIVYSMKKDEAGFFDEYRTFLLLDLKDLDLTFGEIFHHENVNGELFTLQPRKWQRQLFNTRGELQISGSAIGAVIGDGSVLARDGQTLSAYGTQNKWSCILGKSDGGKDVLYWFNAENGLFMRFGADGTVVISERSRFRSYANRAAKWLRGKDTPAFDQGIRAVWDDRSKEVIWTFTGWRATPQWAASPTLFFVTTLAGYVATNANAPFDTYEHLPRFFRCTVSHIASAQNEPGVGADWQNFWEQIPYDDFDYYSVFTVALNEVTNGFKTFYGHIPKTYLKWRDTFLSSHPTERNLIFEHRRGEPTTWYGRPAAGIDPKVEDAHVEMVVNEIPEQTTRGVAVRFLSKFIPQRVDYRTERHHTWDEAAQFRRDNDQWIAPIRKDATVTGTPVSGGDILTGEYLRVKFTIFGGTYNLLHSIVVKFMDRARRINR